MRPSIIKLNLLVFVCCLFLAACTSDDDPVAPPSNNARTVLSKVVFANNDTTTYEYDAQKRVNKASFPANLTINSRYTKEFTYDAQGKLVKSTYMLLNGNVVGYQTFEYTNNLLTKLSSYSRPQGTSDFTHDFDNTLEYNAAKQVVKLITRNPNKPAQDYRYTVFTYNSAGNVIKLMDYVNKETGAENDYTAEYTYDDKNNPYQQATLFGIGAQTLSTNNITSEKETYPLSGQVKNTSRTYTYNESGLPVKETRTTNTNTFEIQNSYAVLK